jgi:hypothetical protein
LSQWKTVWNGNRRSPYPLTRRSLGGAKRYVELFEARMSADDLSVGE